MYYYLSIGSNIDPELNMAKCLEMLLIRFGKLYLRPPAYTKPENINTTNEFINALVILKSDSNKALLKDTFNSIEKFLGRDRSDQNRDMKDRTCDIDIMFTHNKFKTDMFYKCDEKYLNEVINTTENFAKIQVFGSQLSDRPSAIYLDGGPSNKLIIKDEFNAF